MGVLSTLLLAYVTSSKGDMHVDPTHFVSYFNCKNVLISNALEDTI